MIGRVARSVLISRSVMRGSAISVFRYPFIMGGAGKGAVEWTGWGRGDRGVGPHRGTRGAGVGVTVESTPLS